MRIAFYMPFKPMGHPHPSGDLVTGSELFRYLQGQGHRLHLASNLRARWIYWKPWLWPLFAGEVLRLRRMLGRKGRPDLWITYHSYYKAPDPLGPLCSRSLGIPYVIFQGIFSTKRRRRLKTLPGYLLNTAALSRADIVITNKLKDQRNLLRIVPRERLHYVRPGIDPRCFFFDQEARSELRASWQVGKECVILTAAMLRQGVKAQGVGLVIRSCGRLLQQGLRFRLVIAGDGKERQSLERLAQKHVPGRVVFLGRVDRRTMYRFYSGGDLFVFPGIQESLGLVYLEAQSCGLPVVALDGWGAAEAVVHGKTGLLSGPKDLEGFSNNIALLLKDTALREKMGRAARRHVQEHHDAHTNYRTIEDILSSKVPGN
ncbi:MAG: glycosyltransferase family 4 protein [Deltaproteobacteria bacterium]|nr:glycosyltransferase family 4 protein [Deltaproteobacteria bacterium]MBW2063790.1 glycosyltransferase family 4 protein [Deltaproteobacteria bacterium]